MKLCSFDVFDTLITRTTATPEGIFAIMQDTLIREYPDLSARFHNGFFYSRIEAEKIARRNICLDGIEDVSHYEIYETLKSLAYLSDEETAELRRLEIQTEKDNSIPIWENINRVVRCIENGDRVVLISDMYLPSDVIRDILLEHHEVFREIPIYVSSETRIVKGNEQSYINIKKKELVYWNDWIHIGDNRFADFVVPRNLKISARFYSFGRLMACERKILLGHESDAYLQLFIGASRNYRLQYGQSAPRQLGSSYGAAILFQYVVWVLKTSMAAGIRDLYFIARDGDILIKIAGIVKEYLHFDGSMKYIYGSRTAWRVPEYLEEDLGWNSIYEKTETERQLLVDYFKQELNSDAKKIGFVEVQGSGVTQDCLVRILADHFDSEMCSFYFILFNSHKETHQSYRFISDRGDVSCIIETLTRALHGRTVGYKRNDDRIIPVLEDDENGLLEQYGYNDYLEAVQKVISEYSNYIQKNGMALESFAHGTRFFEYLIYNEKGKCFNYICDMPLTQTIGGKEEHMTFAPRYSKKEISLVAKKGSLFNNGWCPSFSLRRCSSEEKKIIKTNLELFKTESMIKDDQSKPSVRTGRHIISQGSIKKRIVLCGAGRVGKDLYAYITENNLAEVVVWTDRSVKEKTGIMDTMSHIMHYKFDQAVIAVKDRLMAYDILVDLLRVGVDEKDIYWELYSREDAK